MVREGRERVTRGECGTLLTPPPRASVGLPLPVLLRHRRRPSRLVQL